MYSSILVLLKRNTYVNGVIFLSWRIAPLRIRIASSDNRDTVANSARAPLDDKSKKELSSKLRTLKKGVSLYSLNPKTANVFTRHVLDRYQNKFSVILISTFFHI